MSRFLINEILATAGLLGAFAIGLPARAADLERSRAALLDEALDVWTIAPVTNEVKAFAKEVLRANPVRIRGDFDGDGRKDLALLIQARAQPVLQAPDRSKATKIAVCLAKTPSIVLRLIEQPYCNDYIYLVRKGAQMYDFEAGELGTYPVDAIGTACFESAGAVYFLDGENFKRIVNSD